MSKTYFLNMFPNEDKFLIASIWEDISLCMDIEYPVYGTTFLPPNIWIKALKYLENTNIKTVSYGVMENSEKRLLVFIPKNFNDDEIDSNIIYFKMDANNKFKELKHKDFLGSILGLGIKREVLGDIIVKDNIGYSVTTKEIYDIIEKNLNQINTIHIKLEKISRDVIPRSEFKEFPITTASLRLDSVVSSITNFSRNISVELIETGDVLLNYSIEKNKNKNVELNDVLTIKGKGKFKINKFLGENKKNKIKLEIKQYI